MKTHHIIHKTAKAHQNPDSNRLVKGARELLAATAHDAQKKVLNTRKRLASAMENGKEAWSAAQAKAVAGAKATDQTIRNHPYQSLGVALGVGALIGYFFRRHRN